MNLTLTTPQRRALWALVIIVIVVRLVSLGAYPLLDPSESRYAEIARKMLETGQWLVPQFRYDVPFWGKPPLTFWLTAGSMGIFGINEFAARLPSLLLIGGCGAIICRLAFVHAGSAAALMTAAVFATTGLVFIVAGAVLTDAALTFGTTLAMAGFWTALRGTAPNHRAAGFAFFIGLAVGLLAKGPIAVVLTMMPVTIWTLWQRQWRVAWTQMPWISGSLLTAALVVPWYWAAERASPGFIEYFLLGEHWKRFTVPGWTGDLYGVAHSWKRGWIWAFWFATAVPWSVVALDWMIRALVAPRDRLRARFADPFWGYLLVWALAPMVLFTAAGNVLPTYVLPGLPAFALIVVFGPVASEPGRGPDRAEFRGLVACAILGLVVVALLVTQHARIDRELAQRALVRTFEAQRKSPQQRLVYLGDQPVSAEFYTRGKALQVAEAPELARYLSDAPSDYFAMRDDDAARIPTVDRARLEEIGQFGKFRLYREVLPR